MSFEAIVSKALSARKFPVYDLPSGITAHN